MENKKDLTVLARENIYQVDTWSSEAYNKAIKHFHERSPNSQMGIHFHTYGMACNNSCFVEEKDDGEDDD